MKKLLVIIITALLVISCNHVEGTVVTPEGGPVEVEIKKLFTVDGVTVYRFYDGGERIYFTNATGNVIRYERGEEGETIIHRTLCNGKIEEETSSD